MAGRLDDSKILHRIAFHDASHLWQLPCRVHLLSACLYRLEDANYPALEALGVSAEDVRRWAKNNLPPLQGLPVPAEPCRSLRLEYQITIRDNGYGVSLVTRPINLPRSETPSQPGGIKFIREPTEWNDLHRQASDLLISHMDEATRRLSTEPSTDEVVRVVLSHILEYADVQECVTGLGRILRNWKAVLE